MEAILKGSKRGKRSILGTMHAVSGALLHSHAWSLKRTAPYRIMGQDRIRDMYGREGHPDFHSGRAWAEFFGRLPH